MMTLNSVGESIDRKSERRLFQSKMVILTRVSGYLEQDEIKSSLTPVLLHSHATTIWICSR